MLKRISLFAIIALVFASCSSEEETVESRELHEYVSASMKGNDEIMAFGSVEVKDILDKTDYKNEQMLKGLIGEELKKLEGVLDMDAPVYFYVEGPMDRKGSPKRTVLFMKVKDADKLAKDLEKERSFLVEKKGDIRYAEDNEFAIGFRDDLAIAIVQPGKYDAAKLMAEAFKKSQGDVSGGKTDKMLTSKGDVVVSMNMGAMYGSNLSMNASSASLKKLQKAAKGSFVQMKLNFNKGSMVLESKNYFEKGFDGMKFMNSKNKVDLQKKLAKGQSGSKVVAGISASIDIKEMEKFYETNMPELMEEMRKNLAKLGPMMKLIGAGDVMSSLLTGEFGLLAISDNSGEQEMGAKAFIGTTDSGQKAFMMMSGEMDLPSDFEFNYVDDGIETMSSGRGGSSAYLKGDSKLKMPKGGEGFGKNGVYGFVNFQAMDMKGMNSQQRMMMDSFDYATFKGGNDGMKLELHMTNKKDNILKQFTQMAMNMMPMMMGGGMGF